MRPSEGPARVEASLNIFSEFRPMSVSSISSQPAPLPFNYLETNSNTGPAAIVSAVVTPDTSPGDDASTAQPPAPPPLPPGQGTRVDQLV